MKDLHDLNTEELPGLEASVTGFETPVPTARILASRKKNRPAPMQLDLLADLGPTDVSGLPAWVHDENTDLTGLPIWR